MEDLLLLMLTCWYLLVPYPAEHGAVYIGVIIDSTSTIYGVMLHVFAVELVPSVILNFIVKKTEGIIILL